jgi:hypothetical protein
MLVAVVQIATRAGDSLSAWPQTIYTPRGPRDYKGKAVIDTGR